MQVRHAVMAVFGAGAILVSQTGGANATPLDPQSVLALHIPQGMDARSTAVIVTGSDGWTDEHRARAERLAELHTMVIGIDGPGLLYRSGGDCAIATETAAALTRRIQLREGALARAPVLVALESSSGNSGSGFALAAAHLRPERFKGLVTAGYRPGTGPCALNDISALGGKAPVRWLDVVPPGRPSVATGLAGVRVVEAEAGPRKAFYRSYLGVAGTDSSFDTSTGTDAADLGDLPLTVHAAPDGAPGDTYAIFLSGDGGWARFDEEISDRLAQSGIPVVGISALRYLWREKKPTRIAADIARIDAHYRRVFQRDRVLLVGFSLGANSMPFAAQNLAPDLIGRLAGIGLIAPESRTGFEIVVGGWLGRETGAHQVGPAIQSISARIGPTKIACLYGTREMATPCPALPDATLHRVAFDGGHHLGKDYAGVAEVLKDLAAGRVPVLADSSNKG